uniref:Uncharacterized protein n=1 Tax=Glossina austeni TaxID=7395 RepID=A0A1A9VYV0_GLOAU
MADMTDFHCKLAADITWKCVNSIMQSFSVCIQLCLFVLPLPPLISKHYSTADYLECIPFDNVEASKMNTSKNNKNDEKVFRKIFECTVLSNNRYHIVVPKYITWDQIAIKKVPVSDTADVNSRLLGNNQYEAHWLKVCSTLAKKPPIKAFVV